MTSRSGVTLTAIKLQCNTETSQEILEWVIIIWYNSNHNSDSQATIRSRNRKSSYPSKEGQTRAFRSHYPQSCRYRGARGSHKTRVELRKRISSIETLSRGAISLVICRNLWWFLDPGWLQTPTRSPVYKEHMSYWQLVEGYTFQVMLFVCLGSWYYRWGLVSWLMTNISVERSREDG
jgi:hypothetical protein